MLGLQAQGDIDDPVVIGLRLGVVQVGHRGVVRHALVRVDRQGAHGAAVQTGAGHIYPLLDLLGRGVIHHLVDHLDSDAGLAADGFVVPVLDVIQFLQDGHGNHDVVLLEGGYRRGVVQQDVGVQHIGLLDDRFKSCFFYAQGGA